MPIIAAVQLIAKLLARLVTKLPAWVWPLLLLSLCWLFSTSYCYRAGRTAERRAVSRANFARDSAATDSIERERSRRTAEAVAALVHDDSLRVQLLALNDSIASRRRALRLLDATHVQIITHDTARIVELPSEIVTRIRSDSATIDSLLDSVHETHTTIDKLRRVIITDSSEIKLLRSQVADLKASTPAAPAQPSRLDRAIARVTVPAAKIASVGCVLYLIARAIF